MLLAALLLGLARPLAAQFTPTPVLVHPAARAERPLGATARIASSPDDTGRRASLVRQGWVLVLEGAVLGAAIGAAAEARRDGVGTGAGRGALIGAGVGAVAWLGVWVVESRSRGAAPSDVALHIAGRPRAAPSSRQWSP